VAEKSPDRSTHSQTLSPSKKKHVYLPLQKALPCTLKHARYSIAPFVLTLARGKNRP